MLNCRASPPHSSVVGGNAAANIELPIGTGRPPSDTWNNVNLICRSGGQFQGTHDELNSARLRYVNPKANMP